MTTEYVTLKSSEGHRFILPRSAALQSEFLKNALTSDFAEASTDIVNLPEHRSQVVEKVGEYLMFKDKYTGSKEEIPDFQERITPEIALELLMSADYLEC